LVIANKRRAPVAVLSPTKRTAVIECFNNNGLHKRRGYWWGTPEGKHISYHLHNGLNREIFEVSGGNCWLFLLPEV
jgi:hypothetical protein